MKDYLKKFKVIGDYNLWKNSENCIAPNVSLIEDNQSDIVDYNSLIIIAPSLTMNGWVYGETPSTPILSGNLGNGLVTYMYKVSTADDSTYTSTQPSEVGTYTIKATINAKGFYSSGSCTITFSIAKSGINPTVTMNDWIYGETASDPVVSGNTGNGNVTYMYKVSTADDSTYTSTKPTDAGTYTVKATIEATSNYGGSSCISTFTINKVTPTVVSPVPNVLTYNKSAQELATIGSTDFGTLKYSLDNSNWSTSMPTATNGGTYTLYYKVDGDSNINNIVSNSITCSIAEKRVSNPTIILSQDVYTYNGSSCTPTPTVKDGNDVINPIEYTISYLNNTNAGTASVVISDIVDGNYYIEGVQTFTINKAAGNVSTAPVANSLTYDGTAQTVASAGTGTGTMIYRLGDSGDYSSTMPTATNAGSYTLYYYTVESANYNATTPASISITINKATGSVSTAPVANSLTYDGTAQTVASAGVGTGTMMYRLGDSGDYNSTMPTATNAGSYTLYYYASESTNYNATTPTSISITVNESQSHNYANDYLTIKSLEDSNTISFKVSNSNLVKTISVSTDNGLIWTDKTSTTSGITLATLNTGDKLLIKGSNTNYGNSANHNYFVSTGEFDVEGNIMSLVYEDNFVGRTTLNSAGYNFKNLFKDCTKLKNAEHLVLPATTLTNYCYQYMFQNCTSLTTAPALPATTLANGCYNEMFQNCTSLTTAPELPAMTLAENCYTHMFNGCASLTTTPELLATTLAINCYYGMFKGCTSLTTAPELPAITLVSNCYQYMFNGCTSLTSAPELPATTLAQYCYNCMFQNCTSLTTAPSVLPATTLAYACYNEMFQGCTALTTAPELPATTLATECYSAMFKGCTSLTTAPSVLQATTLAQDCYNQMFRDCTSLTTAPELPATTLEQRCYRDMFHGCTSLTTAPELPATTLATECYYMMFLGCTSLTTAPELPATTLAQGCYSYMFHGCTALTTASELPATTLANYCYQYMFHDCTALTTAPALPATTLANYCYQYMFQNCTSLTTAPELPATTLEISCYYSMFNGCTSLNYVKCLATNISASSCTSNWLTNVSSMGTFVKADNMTGWTSGTNGIPSGWTKINNSEMPIVWDYTESYLTNSLIKPKLINPFNLPITYSSSDTSITTIDNSGNITFESAGSVTLTAVFIGNETYQAKTATCTFNIVTPLELCTLYDSNNNVLANIISDNSTLSSSLISSYKSSAYKVIINSDCTSIGADAFKEFINLRSVTIPSSVSSIGDSAFYNCISLKEIICNRTTAPSLVTTPGNYSVFQYVARGGVLITPSGSSGYTTWMASYYLEYYNWYNAVGTFGDTEPTLQWSRSSYTITSSYFSTPTLSKQSGISVTYKSSNTSVATISSSGTVTRGSNGITYIQAIFAGNSTYKPKVAVYTLTVSIYSGGSSGGGGHSE